MFEIEIKHQEWLEDALRSAEKTFRLSRENKIPKSIQGWMIVTACFQVLRCIFGYDNSIVASNLTRIAYAKKTLFEEVI